MAWAKRLEDCKDPADFMYCACAVYSCGYSQPKRKNISDATLKAGTAEADCSSMVDWALWRAGWLKENAWFWTAIEVSYLEARGYSRLSPSAVSPRRNDVLWRAGHTGMYVGDGMQAEALRTERGDAGYGGSKPGDQDGGETVVRKYSAGQWTWILRPPQSKEEAVAADAPAGTYVCLADMNVRDAPSTGKVVAVYRKGQTVRLDGWSKTVGGTVWGRYKGSTSGKYRYIAVRNGSKTYLRKQ